MQILHHTAGSFSMVGRARLLTGAQVFQATGCCMQATRAAHLKRQAALMGVASPEALWAELLDGILPAAEFVAISRQARLSAWRAWLAGSPGARWRTVW